MRISDWSSAVCSSDLGDQPRHDQEPAAETEKSRKAPGAETIAEHFRRIMAIAGGPLNAGIVSPAQHQHAYDEHQQREEEEQFLPVDRLADGRACERADDAAPRSEEHTSELQSLMRISYAAFCLKKK